MKRTFLGLVVVSTGLLAAAMVLGLQIQDAGSRDPQVAAQVQYHMLTSLAALMVTALVHAICLTYFMGTGRWMEETSTAYKLDPRFHAENQTLKYRILPAMGVVLALLIGTTAFGGIADPASRVSWNGWGSLTAARLHFFTACTTVLVNLMVNISQYLSIARNGEVVEEVLAEVKRIRLERGLPIS